MNDLYYYQRKLNPGTMDMDPCKGLWMCCGGVDMNTADFYLDWFTNHDERDVFSKNPVRFEVCIVRGFYGKCANRVELDRVEGNKGVYVARPELTKRDMLMWHNIDTARLESDEGDRLECEALAAIEARNRDMYENPDSYFEPDDPRRAW